MSEASRAVALQHAASVYHATGADHATVLRDAEEYHKFIAAGLTANGESPARVPAKTPAKAPAKAKPAPVVEEPDEFDADAVTKEQVGEAIEALLNANMRKQAIDLFAKYKAKSLSGVKAEDYAAIKQDAEDALLNA